MKTESNLLSFLTMIIPLAVIAILSIYSVIAYKSLFGFIFFCLITIVIFIVCLSMGLHSRLNKLENLIDEQNRLIKSLKNK